MEEFLFEECFILDLPLGRNHAKQAIPVVFVFLLPPTSQEIKYTT